MENETKTGITDGQDQAHEQNSAQVYNGDLRTQIENTLK